jgi:hypothetical protein
MQFADLRDTDLIADIRSDIEEWMGDWRISDKPGTKQRIAKL